MAETDYTGDAVEERRDRSGGGLPLASGLGAALIVLAVIAGFWFPLGDRAAFGVWMYRITEVLLTLAAIACVLLLGELAAARTIRHPAPDPSAEAQTGIEGRAGQDASASEGAESPDIHAAR